MKNFNYNNRLFRNKLLNSFAPKKWYKEPNIIVAILLALITIGQTQYISGQNQRIDGFDSLLRTTNSTLDKLNETNILLHQQLTINQSSQEKENEIYQQIARGDKNKFVAAVHSLGEALGNWNLDEKRSYRYIDELDGEYLKKIEDILYNELNNPFVLQHKTLMDDWLNAYRQIKYVTNDNVFDSSFDGFYNRPKSRLDVINSSYKRDVISYWRVINNAYNTSVKYINK